MIKRQKRNQKIVVKRVCSIEKRSSFQDVHNHRVKKVYRLVEVALPGFDANNPSSIPIVDQLRDVVKPMMVCVAPGKYAPARKNGKAPEMSLCLFQDNGDGTSTPVPVTQRLVRLDYDLARMLGFPGGYNTLRRLGEAGFVEIIKAAPSFHLINLDSWFNHLRRCAENPEFWDRQGKNFKVYQSVIL